MADLDVLEEAAPLREFRGGILCIMFVTFGYV